MKPMLATGYEESKVKYPCCVQPKYDGVRCLMMIGDDNEVHLFSRNGKEYNIPHIRKWGEENRDKLPLDGELYNHKGLTFQQICSAVKCYSPLTDMIDYVVYDRPIEKVGFINRWLGVNFESDHVRQSPTYIAENKEDLIKLHDRFVSEGYEGAIIRSMYGEYVEGRSNDLIKLKRFDTTEFEIVDVVEALGQDKGTAIFHLKVGDNVFNARPVGSRELRSGYLRDKENLIGKMCTIQHQGYSDAGVPRFPVALSVRDYE